MSMIGVLTLENLGEGHGLEPLYVDRSPSLKDITVNKGWGIYRTGDIGGFLPSCLR